MNPEALKHSPETGHEQLQQAAEARSEALRQTTELEPASHDKQERLERARRAAEEVFAQEKPQPNSSESNPSPIKHITGQDRSIAYRSTMDRVRSHLRGSSRSFSDIIHAPLVEKASEAMGGTLARPNAMLAGSVSAFIIVTGLYSIAKIFGYPLSGFETIGAFGFGWALGLIYDYARTVKTQTKR